MSEPWYYRLFGEEFGPVTLDEMREAIQNGMVSIDDEVRRANSEHWIAAGRIPQLGQTTSGPRSSTRITPPESVYEWFFRSRAFEDEFGPVSLQELIKFAEEGQLEAEDDVKHGASSIWWKAGAISRLATAIASRASEQATSAPVDRMKPAPTEGLGVPPPTAAPACGVSTNAPPTLPPNLDAKIPAAEADHRISPAAEVAAKFPIERAQAAVAVVTTSSHVTDDGQASSGLTTNSFHVRPQTVVDRVDQLVPVPPTIANPAARSVEAAHTPARALPIGLRAASTPWGATRQESSRDLTFLIKTGIALAAFFSLCGLGWLFGVSAVWSSFFTKELVKREVSPVTGNVAFKNGRPITGGQVTFFELDDSNLPRSKDGVIAKGAIQVDGTYQMGTYQSDDGVPPGKYKVVVTPARPPDLDEEKEDPQPNWPPFNARYSLYNETPLEYTVIPGTNRYAIVVEK